MPVNPTPPSADDPDMTDGGLSVVTPPETRVRVLVVEDDPIASSPLQLLLHHYNFEVQCVATVSQALAAVDSEPHFVLLDLMLPDGDGLEVLQRVRSRALRTSVIVLTASDDPKRRARVSQLSPARYFRKPLHLFDLLEALRTAGHDAEVRHAAPSSLVGPA